MSATTTALPIPGLELRGAVDELWRSTLAGFVGPLCNAVGFSGVVKQDALARWSCFADWQPAPLGLATRTVQWETRARGRRTSEESFTLFRCNAEVAGRIGRARFDDWSVSNLDFAADRLFFFRDDRVVLEAQPYELELGFSNLGPDEIEALEAVDPRLLSYAHEDPSTTVVSSVVWGPGLAP